MHLTLSDIDDMDFGEMLDLMITQQNMLEEVRIEQESDTRPATQDDIDSFFGVR